MATLAEFVAWSKDNPAYAWGTLALIVATATWVLKRS